jgi:hypothetical protein
VKFTIVLAVWPVLFVVLSNCGLPLVMAVAYLTAWLGVGNPKTVADFTNAAITLASLYGSYRVCRSIWPSRHSFEPSPPPAGQEPDEDAREIHPPAT